MTTTFETMGNATVAVYHNGKGVIATDPWLTFAAAISGSGAGIGSVRLMRHGAALQAAPQLFFNCRHQFGWRFKI